MINIPETKIGIVAVSRDCFVVELSLSRRQAVAEACCQMNIQLEEISVVVENEEDVKRAIIEIEEKKINGLVLLLGNFGPEIPETILAQQFRGPVMFVAAAEESKTKLVNDRGDAYCGLLNASYNVALRKVRPYIPEFPVGTAKDIAECIRVFTALTRAILGVKSLKIMTFGPRPYDFVACHAPIKPLYDIGVEVMENSELDLFEAFNKHKNDKRISDVVNEMKQELGHSNVDPAFLKKLAQYELTLLDWFDSNKGYSQYAVFANKCWPAFQTQFGFVPCYVNSRLAAKGIPVACEVDIYGALSEYIIMCLSQMPATLLDINNTVPQDMYDEYPSIAQKYKLSDLFMGFHCGNVSSCCLKSPQLKHQLIMHRLLEPDKEPNITRGTLEGTIIPGDVTLFRLQGSADCTLRSYIAKGEVLDMDPQSFGSIGVIGVKEMFRFYRHVLVEKRFPHHTAVGFKHIGHLLFELMKMLGITEIDYNRPEGKLYSTENPFN